MNHTYLNSDWMLPMKLVFSIFLFCVSTSLLAMLRDGPAPTLFDHVDNADLVFYGTVDETTRASTEGVVELETYTLVRFNTAGYIDGNGRHNFEKLVIVRIPGENTWISPNAEIIFFLTDIHIYPRPSTKLRVENDSVYYSTYWDGSGVIQTLNESGAVEFRKPYHSCKVLNPLFERKRYECQRGDQTIETNAPEDSDPPMTKTALLDRLVSHQSGKEVYSEEDFAALYKPPLTPLLPVNDLQANAETDLTFIEALKTVVLPEEWITAINLRERARGNQGQHRNDPALILRNAELDAKNKLELEREERERNERERIAHLEEREQAEESQAREIEVERDGPAIELNQSEASLSIDVSLLPNCSQLWRSLPLKGNKYYIGNCLRMDSQRVCTMVASVKEVGDNCTPLSQYVGGVITPPNQAFEGSANSPWTPNEIRILHYGAGMPAEELAQVRQPSEAPPLFVGATPTQWNLYLRRVRTIPAIVPDEFR